MAAMPQVQLALTPMLIGVHHRPHQEIAGGGYGDPHRHAANRHWFQDRPELVEGGLEKPLRQVDIPFLLDAPPSRTLPTS